MSGEREQAYERRQTYEQGQTYDGCFACGSANPIGLKLIMEHTAEGCRTTFTPSDLHQGYSGVAHGGIIMSILDEVMAHALILDNGPVVTGRIEIRFRNPARTGCPILARGWQTGGRGRVLEAAAEATDPDGLMLAEAVGKFIRVQLEQTFVQLPGPQQAGTQLPRIAERGEERR